MRAFVIRGFGTKGDVDFDRVHEELIAPALRQLGIDGGTTGEVIEAGNVREDMFKELVLADVVVADVSVHNANVFYELGIRHAVRNRSTVLIRARIDDVPFDLRTDRYLTYDPGSAAASVPRLVQMLRETLAGERTDSPVFQLLPGFVAGPHATLLDLPRDLAEEIDRARRDGQAGDLRLLCDEVVGLRFEEAALRAVARALQRVGDNAGAREAWERVRRVRPDDLEANRELANVYRWLKQLSLSDQAIDRALGSGTLSQADRAEMYTYRGSNSKRLWAEQWRKEGEPDRARAALRSRLLDDSFQFYRRGFEEDLNHWYSGLNALAMAKIMVELADRCPDDWRTRFDTDAEADAQLTALRSQVDWLTSTVRASLDSARSRSLRAGKVDYWIEASVADLRFLTSDEPERVVSAYEAAIGPLVGSDSRRTIREQILMYRQLGIFVQNAVPALALLAETSDETADKIHPVVFAGHMIDAPGRAHPRFPADREDTAKAAILAAIGDIDAVTQNRQERIVGLAGASDGGDLLFHEACHELGIETRVFLPVPERAYRTTAVSGQASRWADRYHAALRNAAKVFTLAGTEALPGWLQTRAGYSVWQRNNRWILDHAWAITADNRVTVLALWNGEVGDGPGGVADMVATAQERGAEVVTLDSVAMFGLESQLAPDRPDTDPAPEPQGDQTPTGAGPAADSGSHDDRILDLVWRYQRQWSKAADAAQATLNQWRRANLILLVLGAIAGALAAQTWLTSAGTAAFAAVSAVFLASAGLIQRRALTSDDTARWTGARAASEALKAESYRYLSKVAPYAGADRVEQLKAQLDVIQDRARTLLVEQQLEAADDRPLPDVSSFRQYLTRRAQDQAEWHHDRVAKHASKARTLHIWQLVATAAGAVLAAIAGALPGSHLSAWTAAATTVAAAIGTHIAATRYERVAASYAATADQLDRLIADVDPATTDPERQAQFVADVERILGTLNESWTDLLSHPAHK
jgi:SMODS and SLOG-associating 2TM effector domain 1/Protein of unknown function (DUF4231)/Tetratricopeptide Repeats-Sensor